MFNLVSVILVGGAGGGGGRGGGGGGWPGSSIWDYQEKRPSCGQREGLNQYPKPLDHHALTK